MGEYNVAFLIKTLQNAMCESQETAGRHVLDTIREPSGYQINIDGKMITGLVKREKEVHNELKRAAGQKKYIKGAKDYVTKNILPEISDLVIADVCKAILNEVESDASTADASVETLQAYYGNHDYAGFLTSAILYALSRGNNIKIPAVNTDDFHFMEEAAYRCPLCGTELYRRVKGKIVNQYRVIQMFPEELDSESMSSFLAVHAAPTRYDSLENRIALCKICASDYIIDPTVNEYTELLEAKRRICKSMQAKSTAMGSQIEKQIADIIHAVAGINRTTDLKPFTDALTLAKKIRPEFFLLQDRIQQIVIRFYPFVENQFSIIDGAPNGRYFNIIRSEVTACYEKLEADGLDQEEICEQLSDWLLYKNNLGASHKTAANIIVAFFVQNCGVFHAIAEQSYAI